MFNKKDYIELCKKYNSREYSKKNILTGEMKGYLIYFYIPARAWNDDYDKHRSIVLDIKTGKCIRFGINYTNLTGKDFSFENYSRVSLIKEKVTPAQEAYVKFFGGYDYSYQDNEERFNERQGVENYFRHLYNESHYRRRDFSYNDLKLIVSDLRRAKVPLEGLINYSKHYFTEAFKPNTNNIKKFFDISVKDLRVMGGTLGTHYDYEKAKLVQEILNIPFKDSWLLRKSNLHVYKEEAPYYKRVVKELLKDPDNARTNYSLYYDYNRMLNTLKRTDVDYKDFPDVPSIETIQKKHDKIVPIYNRIKYATPKEMNDRYKNKFYKDIKKFEYEDDSYSIIACKDLDELVNEGSTLHHCVGSYRNSVSLGQDKILFLRKKDDLETPYFTINLSPTNKVRQIHGKYNSNVTAELAPFIDAWAKKFKIDASSYSGVYCALV